jgi:F-box-like
MSCTDLVSEFQSGVSFELSPQRPFPFHRLPSDLLIAIFQEVWRSSRNYNRHSIPSPIVLSHVCRLWRDVALDAAALWTDIRIYDGRADQIRPYYEMYFERSKSSLLDVSYHSYTAVNGTSVISFVLPHISRVRRLTIMLENDFLLSSIMTLFTDVAAPHLESLGLFLLDKVYSSRSLENKSLQLFNGGAARLRSVQLHHVPCLLQPQFTQLTSFTLMLNGGVRLPPILDLLTNVAKTLVRFRIGSGIFYLDIADYSSSPIELSLLESLDILDARILPYLHTPRLRNLHMRNVRSATLDTFIERCSSLELSTLESLKLDNVHLSCFQNKTAVARGLPLLTELMLWNCTDESTFLSLLKQNDPDNKEKIHHDQSHQQAPSTPLMDPKTSVIIMPHLHTLTLSTQSSWPVLQAIVEDRIAKGIPFRRVRFCETSEAVEHNEMQRRWLTERNIAYDLGDYKTEHCMVDPEDREWMEEERDFQESKEKARRIDGNRDESSDEYYDSDEYSDSQPSEDYYFLGRF